MFLWLLSFYYAGCVQGKNSLDWSGLEVHKIRQKIEKHFNFNSYNQIYYEIAAQPKLTVLYLVHYVISGNVIRYTIFVLHITYCHFYIYNNSATEYQKLADRSRDVLFLVFSLFQSKTTTNKKKKKKICHKNKFSMCMPNST